MASFVKIGSFSNKHYVNADLIADFSPYEKSVNRTLIQFAGKGNHIIVNISTEEVQQLLYKAGHVFDGTANSYHEGQKALSAD